MVSLQTPVETSLPWPGTRQGSRHRILWWLAAAYLIFLPVQFITGDGIGFRFAPSDVFLFFYVVLAFPTLRKFRAPVWNGWHAAVLLSFAAATLTGAIRHGEVTRYVLFNKDFGLLVLFVAYSVLSSEATSWRRIREMLRLFILSVTVTNSLALISYFGFNPWLAENVFKISYTGRLAGMLIDPNAYGGLLAVAFGIHVITFFSAKPLVRGAPGLFVLVSLLAGVLYTYSRSSWISVTFMLIVLSVVCPRVAITLVMMIVLGVGTVIATADRAALDNMLTMSSRPEQVDDRVDIISHAIPMFLNNPLFGVGLGSFEKSYGIIIHNTPVWFLTEFGLMGFVSVAGFYTWYVMQGRRAYALAPPDQRSVVLGLLLAHIAILGLSMGIEAFYQRHWWFTIAMLGAVTVQCSNRISRSNAGGADRDEALKDDRTPVARGELRQKLECCYTTK